MSGKLWILPIIAIPILTAVIYQDRSTIQSLEEERNTCSVQREKLSSEASKLKQQVVEASELTTRNTTRHFQYLKQQAAEANELKDQVAEVSELKQQVIQLKEQQRETDRESHRSSGELAALGEILERLKDARTALDDERDRLKIREKDLKQQLEDFGNQHKAAFCAHCLPDTDGP